MQTNSITKCTKCGKTKQTSEFYRSALHKNGHAYWCKDCMKKDRREYYHKPTIKIKTIKRTCEYQKTSKGKEVNSKAVAKYNAKNPQKYKAKIAVRSATISNKIPSAKMLKCEDCGNQARDYHHESYKPKHWLDVTPLCRPCHVAQHQKDRDKLRK